MVRVARSVHVKAPPHLVWSVLVDVERWPRWATYLHHLVLLDQRTLRLGSRVKVKPRGMPGAVWTVTEFAEGRSYTWIAVSWGLRLAADHVLDREDGGTRVTLTLKAYGPLATVLAPFLRVIFQRNTRLATAGLQRFTETRRSTPLS